MHLTKHLLRGLLSTVLIASHCLGEDPDQRQQLWVDRTVETTVAIVSDPSRPRHDKEYSVGVASNALGQAGCLSEALELFDQPGIGNGSEIEQKGLLSLADGLSSGDFVDDALETAGKIENEYLHGLAIRLIAIRQSQRGDFEDAEALLDRIPSGAHRDSATKQICIEYIKTERLDDALRLSAGISDKKVLSQVNKEISSHSKRLSVADEGYVEYRLAQARNGTFGSASTSELEFLGHYYRAEVALSLNDKIRFNKESGAARKVAEQMHENDGPLLLLGRMLFRAGKPSEAKTMYSALFDNYSMKTEVNPFDFNMLLFGHGPNSDASIVVDCMSDEELKDELKVLLKLPSSDNVAAPIFGAVVKRRSPGWAHDLYESTKDLKLKNSLAYSCLFAHAK